MTNKKVTVGCTVNLGNYENLRVEIEAEMGGSTGYYDLHVALANLLATFGRRDPATTEAIDGYIFRVLGMGGPVVQAPAVQAAAGCGTPEAPGHVLPMGTVPARDPSTGGPVPPKATTGTPTPPPVTTAAPAAPPPIVSKCSMKGCSEGVTAAQEKISNTFFGKTLCRKHNDEEVEKVQRKKK